MFKFNLKYFLWFLLLLLVEVLIARFAHDTIIRPFVGDFLVVILIYCFIRGLFKSQIYSTAIGVLLFSYFIEFMQYLHWVNLLGLDKSYLLSVIMGNYFAWLDILMYTMGILTVIIIEEINQVNRNRSRGAAHQKAKILFI